LFLNPCKYAVALCVGLFLIMAGNVGRADEFRLVPGASLKEEFNDNIFFSSGNTKSSFISTLSPKLSLVERTERLDARIDSRLDFLHYTEDNDLNSVDQSYQGRASYRLTPLFGLSGEAGYTRNTRPDSFLDTTGQVTTQESERQRYSLTGDITLSEKLSATLGYSYEQTDYNPDATSNSRAHSADLGLIYDMDGVLPMLKLRGNLGYNTNHFTGLTLDMYTATVGFSYAFHELWSVQANGGATFGHSEFTEQALVEVSPGVFAFSDVKRTNDDIGWTASLTFSYKGETGSADLNFLHEIQSSYGSSGAVERTALTAELRHRFTHEFSTALSGGYYENSSKANQFSLEATDEKTYRVAPSLRYEFTPDMNLDCYYEYANVQDNQAGTESQRNMVFVRFSVQHPFFE
jgi:hypothetical protein